MTTRLRQLAYLESVARCGGYEVAAAEHDVAASVIAAEMSDLERALGRRLLTQTPMGPAVTPFGLELCSHLRIVVSDVERSFEPGKWVGNGGHLAIGLTATLGSLDVRAAMASLHEQLSDVTIRIASGLLTGLLDKLRAGEIDLVFGPLHPSLVSTYRSIPLTRDHLVLATSPSYPHRGCEKFDLHDFDDQPWATLPRGTGIRSILDAEAGRQNFEPQVKYEVGLLQARTLVSQGDAVSLMPMSVARIPGPSVAVSRVNLRRSYPPIGAVYSAERPLSHAARTCVEFLRKRHDRFDTSSPKETRTAGARSLTPREMQVMGLIGGGLSTRLIAKDLNIKPRTVDKHVERAMRKLAVTSRIQALAVLRLSLA